MNKDPMIKSDKYLLIKGSKHESRWSWPKEKSAKWKVRCISHSIILFIIYAHEKKEFYMWLEHLDCSARWSFRRRKALHDDRPCRYIAMQKPTLPQNAKAAKSIHVRTTVSKEKCQLLFMKKRLVGCFMKYTKLLFWHNWKIVHIELGWSFLFPCQMCHFSRIFFDWQKIWATWHASRRQPKPLSKWLSNKLIQRYE